jgi:hypothetical protein
MFNMTLMKNAGAGNFVYAKERKKQFALVLGKDFTPPHLVDSDEDGS